MPAAKKKAKKKAAKRTKAKQAKPKSKAKPKASPKGRDDFYARQAQQKNEIGGGGRGKSWKPGKSGEKVEVVRFFAYDSETTGLKELAHRRATHWVEDPEDSDNQLALTCPGEETCPLCEIEDEVSEGVWRDISPRIDYMVNCIVQEKDGGWTQPAFGKIQPGVWKRVLEAWELEEDLEHCFEPDKRGRSWKIINNGKTGKLIRYTSVTASMRQNKPAIEPELRDLASLLREPDMDKLEAIARTLK